MNRDEEIFITVFLIAELCKWHGSGDNSLTSRSGCKFIK